MARQRVLVVDDEAGVRFGVRDFLESSGYEVEEAESCQRAQEVFRAQGPDAVIADFKLPDGDALELLPRLQELDPAVPVVVLTAHGSIELAVRAIKEGAEQFLTKPVELQALLVVLRRVLENRRTRQKELAGRSQQARRAFDPFLGVGKAVQQLAAAARKVLASESPILIKGETGAGKGVLARWLHDQGPRAEEAFVDLNCAGLMRDFLETELFGHGKGAFTGAVAAKPGLLESAHRGTLFLDEVGDVDPQVQPKLLKVLEEKQFRRLGEVRDRRVDVRLIAATHQDLGRLVQEKRFRSDLYFRICAIPLFVPPLRERMEDIPVLASHLLARCGADLGRGPLRLSEDALRTLRAYPWPGNIRELRNVLERAALLSESDLLTSRDLHFDVPAGREAPAGTESSGGEDGATLDEVERRHVERILRAEQGRVEEAARRLGIPRSTLYEKIKRYGLSLSRIQNPPSGSQTGVPTFPSTLNQKPQ